MAVKVSGNRGLNFTATLDVNEAKRNAQELKKVLSDLGINSVTQAQTNFNKSQIAFQNELRKARLELAALKKEEQEYKNQTVASGAATAELTRKIAENRLAQQELAKAARAAKEANKAVAGSYKEAQERLKALGLEIRNTSNGFNKMSPELRNKIKEYRELNEKLKQFDATMGNHQRNVGNYKSALEGLKGLAASYLSVATILSIGKAVVDVNAEISDSLADVRRTAGLTAKEAENLSEQLKKIDTRTDLKGLLEITTIGGQLGIAKDQLAGFTKAVDQLAVSLGGELEGGAEGIAKSLGVIDNVFGITTQNAGDVEKSYNQIGSAILGLGQSGLATGDYLTDFSNRVGGLAKQFGISLPVVLSYGAVLQESGVNAEVAGTSFNRLISNLTTNREKFYTVAKIADANLTLKDFTNIINTDTNRALSLFFAGLQKGGNTTTAFNDILKSLNLTGAGVSQAVAALSGHQAELNGHIEQAKKDFDDATLSIEQFAIKNDNLAGSIEKLDNSFSNAVSKGRIRDFFKSIIDGLTDAIKSFDKFVNSSSWAEFKHRLLDSDGGDAWALGNSFMQNKRKTGDNQQFLYPTGVTPEKLEEKLFSKGEKWNQSYLKNLKKTMDDAKALVDEYEAGVKSGRMRENEVTINDYKANYNKAKTYYQDVAKLQVKFGFGQKKPGVKTSEGNSSTTPAQVNKTDPALTAAKTFSQKLTELHNASFRKTLSNDDAEIQAVKDKYAKMTKEAEEYYNNPKNHRTVQLNGKNVSKSEVLGTLKTDQEKEEQAILDKRRKEVEEKEKKAAKEHYEKLLKDYMDYGQKRDDLTKTFEADLKSLENDPRQAAVRKTKYEKDLKELDDSNSKKLDSYEKLLAGIEDLSDKSAIKALEGARAELAKDIKSGAIVDPAEIAKIKKYFNDVETTIRNGSGKALIDLAHKVDDVAASVSNIDEAFGKVLGTLGNVIGQLGNVKQGFADFKSFGAKGDTLGQLGAGLGIVGAGISIFSSVIKMFDRSAQREEQAAYARDMQNKQTEALNKALERQIALLDDVYGTDKIKKYSEAIAQARQNEEKYASELTGRYALVGNKDMDELITKMNNGEKLNYDERNGKRMFLKSKIAVSLPTDIESLQRLLDEGKLDSNTATIVQNLIKANETAKELANNLRAEMVGSNLSQIADDFINTLTDGTQDFGKTFEQTIQKSILNGFKGELIRKQLQAFYEQFATLSEGGLTAEEIDVLRKSYIDASEKAKADLAALSKATGVDLTNNSETSSQGTLSKGIQGITETTANRMEAEFGGMRLAQLQTNSLLMPIGKSLGDLYLLARDNFAIQQQIERNTYKTAVNTEKLKGIEEVLVAMNGKISNTSAIGRGAGLP